ncbi:MAG: hypothetical protein GY861_02465 [bacterium]|nr:hypothetical protein [bacterium]
MYTEIYVNIDLVENLPEDVLYVLKGLCRNVEDGSNFDNKPFNHVAVDWDDERFKGLIKDKGSRFDGLFNNGSFYTPNTSVSNLTYDHISRQWSLLGKGDLKNYSGEIENFFSWIAPYSETEFMGYSRYEESETPHLVFRSEIMKDK